MEYISFCLNRGGRGGFNPESEELLIESHQTATECELWEGILWDAESCVLRPGPLMVQLGI